MHNGNLNKYMKTYTTLFSGYNNSSISQLTSDNIDITKYSFIYCTIKYDNHVYDTALVPTKIFTKFYKDSNNCLVLNKNENYGGSANIWFLSERRQFCIYINAQYTPVELFGIF